VSVVAVHRESGEASINPGPDHVLEVGDVMVVIGPAGTADSLAAYGVEQ